MESLLELVLLYIVWFFFFEDIVWLGCICKCLYLVMLWVELVNEEWLGDDFYINGLFGGDFCFDLYFDVLEFFSIVMKLSLFVIW